MPFEGAGIVFWVAESGVGYWVERHVDREGNGFWGDIDGGIKKMGGPVISEWAEIWVGPRTLKGS